MFLIDVYSSYIQLFRKSLLEKVHATIQRGIVVGFEFTVLQRKWIEWQERPWTVCLRVLKESNKSRFDSYKVTCIDHIPYYLSGLLRAHIFLTTFLEIAVYKLA